MWKLESTRNRTYILNIYACGNWKARETARTFSISMHAEIGNHAKPHVDSLQLYIRKALNQLSRTYDSLLGWRNNQTIQPIKTIEAFALGIYEKEESGRVARV